MIIPALIYTIFNNGTNTSSGWGIPMATDIALLLGSVFAWKRVPDSLKVCWRPLPLSTISRCCDRYRAVLFFGISLMYLSISAGIFCWFWINTSEVIVCLFTPGNFVVVLHVLLWCPFQQLRVFTGNDYSIDSKMKQVLYSIWNIDCILPLIFYHATLRTGEATINSFRFNKPGLESMRVSE